jgi:DNA-binding GntR family transcriptional regulator
MEEWIIPARYLLAKRSRHRRASPVTGMGAFRVEQPVSGRPALTNVGDFGDSSGGVARPTAVQQAYAFLKSEIVAFRFKPGDPLNETQLTSVLGISRTPIREALRRLENEGLVRTVRYKGSFVAPLAIDDLMEIYFVREVLEGVAAALAVGRIDDNRLAEFEHDFVEMKRENLSQQELTRLTDLDIAFHQLVLLAAGNKRLRTMVGALNDQAMRFRYIGVAYRPSRTVDELLDIIGALKREDARGAERAMRAHIRGAAQDIVKSYSVHY